MKIILPVLAAVILAAGPLAAADATTAVEQALESTQSRKLEAAARIIVLEGDRKESFDALFAEFQEALTALNGEYAGLGWRLLEQSKTPSVEETKKILRGLRDLEVRKMDLREQYFEKFAQIFDPTQLIRLLQLENKADAILKHTMALAIPFLE